MTVPRAESYEQAPPSSKLFKERMADDTWVAQQKLDGTRCQVHIRDGAIDFLATDGTPLRHSAAAQHFPSLREEFIVPLSTGESFLLDGELLHHTGQYVCFDLLEWSGAGEDLRTWQQESRRRMAESLYDSITSDRNWLVYEARGTEAKAALLTAVEAIGGEGIMLKDGTAPYVGGKKRVAHSLKVKLRKDVDCIVTARNEGASCNAHLAVFTVEDTWQTKPFVARESIPILLKGGHLRPIGSCSMIGKPDAQVGDVVTVRYLYASTDLVLYQPSLKEIRHDKVAGTCTLDQLRPVSRQVVRSGIE